MRTRSLVLLAAGGLVLGAVGTAFVLTSDHEDNKGAFLSLALTVGLSFLVSGVLALWRRPENRTGALLVAVAYFWFLGGLTLSNDDWVFTLGVLVNSLALGAFVHLLLGFPTGRLLGRRDVLLVIGTYTLVFVGSLAQLLVEERPDATSCPDCKSMIAVTDSDTASTVVGVTVGVLALALVAAIFVIVVIRYLHARGALRRALGPVLGTGALVMLVLLLELVVGTFSDAAADPLYYVFLVTFALVPVAFLAGVLRSRLARAGVGDVLLALARGTPIRDALAQTLGDPTLEIAYWLPESGRYVSADGKPLVEETDSRAVTLVEHAGRPTAAILHDPTLKDEPELVEAVAAAAGLWLDNERLQAKLRAQLEFLETTVDTSPSLLCSLDRDGRIANLNLAATRASGYSDQEEVRWQAFWDVFVAPEERDDSRVRFEEAAPFHKAVDFEHTFVNRTGKEVTVAWSTAPLYDEQGNVRSVICGGLDITERRQRELELEVERDFAGTVANTIPIFLVGVWDDATVNEYGPNPAFEQQLGWNREDVSRPEPARARAPRRPVPGGNGDQLSGERRAVGATRVALALQGRLRPDRGVECPRDPRHGRPYRCPRLGRRRHRTPAAGRGDQSVAIPDRRGRRRSAPPTGAEPPRRRSAAARRAGALPATRAVDGELGSRRGAGRPRIGAGGARGRSRRPARAGTRNPSGGAHRPRPRSSCRGARDALSRAGRRRDHR